MLSESFPCPAPVSGGASLPGSPPGAVPAQADPWTARDVEGWLKAGFAEMLYRPVYAARGALLSTDRNKPSSTFDIVAFAETVLGRGTPEHRAVLIWARSAAARKREDWSVAEFCRDMRWDRSTFDRRRKRACRRIAEAKNAIDCRWPQKTVNTPLNSA